MNEGDGALMNIIYHHQNYTDYCQKTITSVRRLSLEASSCSNILFTVLVFVAQRTHCTCPAGPWHSVSLLQSDRPTIQIRWSAKAHGSRIRGEPPSCVGEHFRGHNTQHKHWRRGAALQCQSLRPARIDDRNNPVRPSPFAPPVPVAVSGCVLNSRVSDLMVSSRLH